LDGARLGAAGDGHQQGRLAGAVGADDGHDLAALDPDADAVQRLDVAVMGVDADHLQHQERTPAAKSAATSGGSSSSSVSPRYALITLGSRLISSGVPSAILRP